MISASGDEARTRHLVVVDDDDRLRELIREYLERQGFRVTSAADAAAARRLIANLQFDLAVVDVMMPGEDGLSLTRWITETRALPVLMLTAKGAVDARIAGLTAGADDYLGKPFEPRELVLRIAAILRRVGAREAERRRLRLGRFTFDVDRGELYDEGAPVRLTEGEARLLTRLAMTQGEAVDRLVLAQAGDGRAAEEVGFPPYEAEASARAVDVQVTRLRRKIEVDPRAPRYLQTVRGVGYRLAPD